MSSSFSQRQHPGQAVRSQVFKEPLGQLVLGALLLGGALLALPIGAVSWSSSRVVGGVALGLGVGLLLLAGRLATRNSSPLLLTLNANALHLAPLRYGTTPSVAAETIPLSSIVAYKHWLSRGRVFARYYLRLELADGRVLRLADPPGALPDNPAGTVSLRELVTQLARQVEPGTVVRPLFSQTVVAYRLMQVSWLVGLTALGLLWDRYLMVGVGLLACAVVYLLSYYQARRQTSSDSREV